WNEVAPVFDHGAILPFVARISAAICGVSCGEVVPACRCAHAATALLDSTTITRAKFRSGHRANRKGEWDDRQSQNGLVAGRRGCWACGFGLDRVGAAGGRSVRYGAAIRVQWQPPGAGRIRAMAVRRLEPRPGLQAGCA